MLDVHTFPDTAMTTVWFPNTRVVVPSPKPAGTSAGCVAPAGWLVITVGSAGWPVTLPSESVCVNSVVAGFSGTELKAVILAVSCANAKLARAIDRSVKYCMMSIDLNGTSR